MPTATQTNIDSVLTENRVFECSDEFRSQAHIRGMEEYERLYQEAETDPGEILGRDRLRTALVQTLGPGARLELPLGQMVLRRRRSTSPTTAWTAMSPSHRRNKAAIIWEGEPGEVQTLTYQQLLIEVSKFANVLKSLGVQKGDRVAIYMGMCPALPIAMLACARIGAPHTVIFGGFSANALVDRITDSQACLRDHAGRLLPARRRSEAEARRR